MAEEKPFASMIHRYREMGGDVVERARKALDQGADWVAEGTQPVHVVTEKTIKLNKLTHNAVAKLIRQQGKFVEGTVQGMAKRLHAAADADSIKSLIDSQVALMPATRKRIVDDARKTITILSDTRDEFGSLVKETFTDLSSLREETAEKTKSSTTTTRKKTASRTSARSSAGKTETRAAA